jgi:hypothetical protein
VTVLGETRAALAGGLLVVVDAARLLVRHFPALLTVFLLGTAAHNAVMWVAVRIGREHPVVASLLVPLAPLGMVVALVVMMRTAGRGLVEEDADRSFSRRISVLTATLIPFLTVYTVTGALDQDRQQFINESYADERYLGNFFSPEGISDRSIVTLDHLQLILIAVFLALRLLIDLFDLADRHPAWGLVRVVVEVTWLTWLATLLTARWGDLRSWVGDLVVVDALGDAWRSITAWVGPMTDPLRAVGDLFARTLDQIGPIVVTPVAWLAVGAVVLVGAVPSDRRALPLGDTGARLHGRYATAFETWRARRSGPTAKALDLLVGRFGDLVDGLRVLVRAGLLPLLTFCLVLPLARLVEWGAAVVLRAALGPREPETMVLFSRYLDIVTSGAYTLVVVVLAVAAVDRLLLRRPAALEGRAPSGQPATSIST